jgi:hypothetical protein
VPIYIVRPRSARVQVLTGGAGITIMTVSVVALGLVVSQLAFEPGSARSAEAGMHAGTPRAADTASATQASFRELARQSLTADLQTADQYAVPAGLTVDLSALDTAKQSAADLLAEPVQGAVTPLYATSSALLHIAIDTTDREVQAAKAAAAAQAAAAQAAAAARARAEYRTPVAADSGPFTVNVWTSSSDQVAIDACRGGVAWTGYPVATIAQHWTCGGSRFPRSTGAMVTITGYDAGTYRVVGVVSEFDAYTATGADIPGGYPLLYQTCLGDSAHTTILIALQPVG